MSPLLITLKLAYSPLHLQNTRPQCDAPQAVNEPILTRGHFSVEMPTSEGFDIGLVPIREGEKQRCRFAKSRLSRNSAELRGVFSFQRISVLRSVVPPTN